MLSKIIENKIKEVRTAKANFSLSRFRDKLTDSKRDFKDALSKNKLNLIAEFKRRSPSQKGISQKNALIGSKRFSEIMKVYDEYADAISILTDGKFFGGSLKDMENASKLTSLPILRKDFIIDEYQIYESRFYNADAILLIASQLENEELNRFIKIAGGYGMDCLVEVHTKEELKRALKSDAEIIGINNRNLETLQVDLGTVLKLAGMVPKGRITVAESGVSSKDYLERIKGKVNAVLVGTMLMNSKNLEKEILSLID